MPAIIFSPKASEDLDEIKAYIESELGSPNVACKKILEILDAIDNLAVFPDFGIVVFSPNLYNISLNLFRPTVARMTPRGVLF